MLKGENEGARKSSERLQRKESIKERPDLDFCMFLGGVVKGSTISNGNSMNEVIIPMKKSLW